MFRRDAAKQASTLGPGTSAPDFTLPDMQGQSISLSDYPGKSESCWCSTGGSCDPSAAGTWRNCAKSMANSSPARPRSWSSGRMTNARSRTIGRKAGQVVYVHYGGSIQNIPPNREVLAVLDQLVQEGGDA